MNYQKLFDCLQSQHGITALESEMQEIVNIVEEMKQVTANSIPTSDEIKTVLYNCAKVTSDESGVKMERLFDKEAEAILELFAKH